jgi:hypothetical protein
VGLTNIQLRHLTDHVLYLQELGFNDGSTVPETPLVTSITSSPIDIQDGEQFAFITRLFPDLRLRPESGAGAAADFTIRVRNSTSEAFAKEVIVPYTGTTSRFKFACGAVSSRLKLIQILWIPLGV